MALAVTQPYIGKAHIELIDSNTDPNFNQLLSAHAFLAQAQQALRKLQNVETDPTKVGAGDPTAVADANYFRPKYIGNVPATAVADIAAYRASVDAALVGITAAIVELYSIIADANS